ncbi:MAG: hypothetical protein AB1705_16425 [Verrucomicrobiota bacterium]
MDVQKFEHEEQLPSRLTIRNQWSKPRSKFGINIRFARKGDGEAEVYSRAPWLDFQERGGTKKPSGKVLLIPVVGGARPTPTAVVDRKLKPRKGRAGVFFHPRFDGVFRRVGDRLKLLFGKATSARVKARLDFEGSGKRKAQDVLEGNFVRAYEQALRTRR